MYRLGELVQNDCDVENMILISGLGALLILLEPSKAFGDR